MYSPRYLNLAPGYSDFREIGDLPFLAAEEAEALSRVTEVFPFRANDYYLDLIDWDDPDDPLRRMVIPHPDELDCLDQSDIEEALDPCNEADNTVAPGVQHKYPDTALVLAADTCTAYCRYCFRKRLFLRGQEESVHDPEPAFAYVESHPEITDVLLTGGDPLVLATGDLAHLMRRFAALSHVKVIRIGTKAPAYNPFRVLGDPDLTDLVTEIVESGTAVYIMVHFDHPRELTREARAVLRLLRQSGALLANQCPLLRGVNDDEEILRELFETMTRVGAPQYYLFQNRPTAGNTPFAIPLVKGWRLFLRARRASSGLSRRARFCMSHATGKVEVVGLDGRHLYCRYHRARDTRRNGRIMVFRRDEQALWFDDLEPVSPDWSPADAG